MAWTYNSVRIYVTDLDTTSNQIIARLQPLDGRTILQVFGYESPTFSINCYIVGDTNQQLIEGMIDDGVAHTLAGNDGFSKDLYLVKASFKRSKYLYQSLDTSQACTTPVYETSLEFMID